MNMKINLDREINVRTIARVIVGILALIGLFSLIYYRGEGGGIIHFFWESVVFLGQAVIISAMILILVFLIQRVRSMPSYDRDGAGDEMAHIRGRLGTDGEKNFDAMAIALQYASTTLFIAIAFLSFFLIHTRGG